MPKTFFIRYRTDAVGSSYTTVLINGGLDDQTNHDVEVHLSYFVAHLPMIKISSLKANLNIQYTTGISFPTPNMYYR